MTVGSDVSGIASSAVKYPDALDLKETVEEPAVTVPEVFFGKPVPVTFTAVPALPVSGLNVIDAVAACAGAPLKGSPKARSMTRHSIPLKSCTTYSVLLVNAAQGEDRHVVGLTTGPRVGDGGVDELLGC